MINGRPVRGLWRAHVRHVDIGSDMGVGERTARMVRPCLFQDTKRMSVVQSQYSKFQSR
jgi:hypothetical protein